MHADSCGQAGHSILVAARHRPTLQAAAKAAPHLEHGRAPSASQPETPLPVRSCAQHGWAKSRGDGQSIIHACAKQRWSSCISPCTACLEHPNTPIPHPSVLPSDPPQGPCPTRLQHHPTTHPPACCIKVAHPRLIGSIQHTPTLCPHVLNRLHRRGRGGACMWGCMGQALDARAGACMV